MRLSNTLFFAPFLLLSAIACSKEPQKSSPAPANTQAEVSNPHQTEVAALDVGAKAPSITLRLHDGTSVALDSLKGKSVLIFFYPKDDTPGCTIEAKGLRDDWASLQATGLVVYGVSTQDERSHKAFIEKHGLPFPLVVDTNGEVAKAFRVPLYNELAARQSFLIGKDGTIKQIWLDVDPKEHARTVLAAAKSMQ